MSLLRIACVFDANPNLVPSIIGIVVILAVQALAFPLAVTYVDTYGFWNVGGLYAVFSGITITASGYFTYLISKVFINSYRKLLRSERWGMSIRNPLIHS